MKSTLSNMVLVLFVITLISATSLGLVYNVTKGPIEAAKNAKTTNALAQVMPKFDNDPTTDTTTYIIDAMPIKVYKGTMGGVVSGYAVETITRSGFSGEIRMMVGLKPDGEIVNIEVLQHNETPGLGSKIADPDNVLLVSFMGKNPEDLKMSVRKDGGDIDVITASTISSRAYVDAVERGYKAYVAAVSGGGITDAEAAVDHRALVLPGDGNWSEPQVVMVDGDEVVIYSYLSEAGLLGYAVEASADGVSGIIRLMVGFTADGVIHNVAVVDQNEAPAYGMPFERADNAILASLKGEKAADVIWSFTADGGTVDAISGATRTSQAYLQAVKNAYIAYQSFTLQEQDNE